MKTFSQVYWAGAGLISIGIGSQSGVSHGIVSVGCFCLVYAAIYGFIQGTKELGL